jgi:hypothetical protein
VFGFSAFSVASHVVKRFENASNVGGPPVLKSHFAFRQFRLSSALDLTRRLRVAGLRALANRPPVPHELVPVNVSLFVNSHSFPSVTSLSIPWISSACRRAFRTPASVS